MKSEARNISKAREAIVAMIAAKKSEVGTGAKAATATAKRSAR